MATAGQIRNSLQWNAKYNLPVLGQRAFAVGASPVYLEDVPGKAMRCEIQIQSPAADGDADFYGAPIIANARMTLIESGYTPDADYFEPTSSLGRLLIKNEVYEVNGRDTITRLRLIADVNNSTTGGSVTCFVTYYGIDDGA